MAFDEPTCGREKEPGLVELGIAVNKQLSGVIDLLHKVLQPSLKPEEKNPPRPSRTNPLDDIADNLHESLKKIESIQGFINKEITPKL